ncbi:MAG: L,D-transpeptidase family protein, partial [Marinobacter sp.]|nr:L,D-transpeptidase family protein [Marinobacter sp.]
RVGFWCLVTLLAGLFVGQPVAANEIVRKRMESMEAGYAVAAGGETLISKLALPRFYQQRDNSLAWPDPGVWSTMLVEIEQAANDGLQPDDYHRQALQRLIADAAGHPDALTIEQRTDLDLLLTDAFLMLGSHLLEGKVNPETIDTEWLANRRQGDMVLILNEALANGSVSMTLAGLRPNQPGYRRLMARRGQFVPLLEQPWPVLAGTPSIRPQQTDSRLPEIRRRLSLLQDFAPAGDSAGPDDVYDDGLQVAVERFQRRHGLDTDGIIGKATLAMLNRTPRQRLDQIDANLERWRWLPDQLGDTYIMVNIAGFELELVSGGEVKETHRVVVGRNYRRSPAFSDRIRYLVFNPVWTVPVKLMVEDKLPEIRRDPGYLSRLGFRVYRGWGEQRQQVDPASIDWNKLSATHFPYQLVQEAGPKNALGQIKFMFPNKFDVYLHDTPAKELFREAERSFSSGCIRVENPARLAESLLADTPGWDASRIQAVLASGEGQTVYLKKPVPVHLQYWTVWADDSGVVQFRRDIYDRDARVLAALRSRPSDQ